jgi:hypothetical protein
VCQIRLIGTVSDGRAQHAYAMQCAFSSNAKSK